MSLKRSNCDVIEECPFCGHHAYLFKNDFDDGTVIFFVQCSTCGARARGSENADEALSRWEMRMPSEQMVEIRLFLIESRLEKMCEKLGIKWKEKG